MLADSLTATANDRGETLAAWEDGCSDEEFLDYYANTRVAIGSVGSGFQDLGAITPSSTLSSPTAVALDDAGDAWVSGVDRTFTEYLQKQGGARYDIHGGWFALQPAGGHFGAPVSLPGGSQVEGAEIAGNPAGEVLVAWRVRESVYLAWTSPTGGLSTPQRLPGRLSVLGLGVDRRGRALVVLGGEPSAFFLETTREVLTSSAAVGGRFTRPRAVLRRQLDRRRHLSEQFYNPVVAMDSSGGALLAWTTIWVRPNGEEGKRPEASYLARVRPSGRLGPWRRSPIHFLPDYISLATDPLGSVLFEGEGSQLFALGRVGEAHTRLGRPDSALRTHVAVNLTGEVAIGWSSFTRSEIVGMLATVTGSREPPVRFATHSNFSQITTTIDAAGAGTIFWTDQNPQGIPILDAHAIAPGGSPIEVGVGLPATSKPQH
ncbi:MAG TPA: hypothetical protein VLJ80_07360 [Solirubrobacteraceae bacterium]|nr:hypothetical protein [Solirubrobacteraceae bacterium]